MKKTTIAVVVSLVAGFAAAAVVLRTIEPEPIASGADAGDYFDQSAATEERIRALEAVVAEERNARHLLEEELLALFDEIERFEKQGERRDESRPAQGRVDTEAVQVFRQMRSDRSTEGRRAALIEAGIAPERAEWILQRESELRFESMQARFDARNSDDPQARFATMMNSESMLRAEIGDSEYEQYLQANNRSTSVGVSNVMASSAAQNAGLQVGDRIVRYGGQRVFSVQDLMRQTMQGKAGESVIVDITRDGVAMQLVMPRGPLGIESSRFGGR